MRRAFKQLNRFMVLMFRLGLGPFVNAWPAVGGRILVLGHTGRKTGRRRRTPVNYALVDGELYIGAGFGPTSDWYRNLLKNNSVEIWLPNGWFAGTAEEIGDHPRRLLLLRQILFASGVVGPLLGLDPRRLSDAELAAATADYGLFHLRRDAPRAGRGGPGDLAWVWLVAIAITLLGIVCRRKVSVDRV
jgi:deazaflavin-dependent oxidoreductase (nitroreductase family)